jgi:hypothetical protein
MAIGTHGRESVIVAEGAEVVAATADCASCNVMFLLCRILLSDRKPLGAVRELSASCDEASLGNITEWVGGGSCRRRYCVVSGRLYWRLDAYGRGIDATCSVTRIHRVIEDCRQRTPKTKKALDLAWVFVPVVSYRRTRVNQQVIPAPKVQRCSCMSTIHRETEANPEGKMRGWQWQ